MRNAPATRITPNPLAGGRLPLPMASAQLENLKPRFLALRGGERSVNINRLGLRREKCPAARACASDLWPAAGSEENRRSRAGASFAPPRRGKGDMTSVRRKGEFV